MAAYRGDFSVMSAAAGGNKNMMCQLVAMCGARNVGNEAMRMPRGGAGRGHCCPFFTAVCRGVSNASGGHEAVVRYLVRECGVDPNHVDGSVGCTALCRAIDRGDKRMVRVLVEECNADVNKPSFRTFTPLGVAAASGHRDIAWLLLVVYRADPNHAGQLRSSPLYLATERGIASVVRLLLRKSAAPIPPLELAILVELAAEEGHTSVIRHLVKLAGACVNRPAVCFSSERAVNHMDIFQESALCKAVLAGETETAIALVREFGAHTAGQDSQGRTLVAYAAVAGDEKLVDFLIEEKGSDVHTVDWTGYGPVDHAAAKGYLRIVRALVEKGGARPGPHALEDTATWGRWATLEYLVKECDVDLNPTVLFTGQATPVSLAAKKERLEIVRFLVEHGADVNACPVPARGCMQSAAERHYLEMVEYLAMKGAHATAMFYTFTPSTGIPAAVERGLHQRTAPALRELLPPILIPRIGERALVDVVVDYAVCGYDEWVRRGAAEEARRRFQRERERVGSPRKRMRLPRQMPMFQE